MRFSLKKASFALTAVALVANSLALTQPAHALLGKYDSKYEDTNYEYIGKCLLIAGGVIGVVTGIPGCAMIIGGMASESVGTAVVGGLLALTAAASWSGFTAGLVLFDENGQSVVAFEALSEEAAAVYGLTTEQREIYNSEVPALNAALEEHAKLAASGVARDMDRDTAALKSTFKTETLFVAGTLMAHKAALAEKNTATEAPAPAPDAVKTEL